MKHSAPPAHLHAALVEQACRAMEAGEERPCTLAEQAGMSRFHFHSRVQGRHGDHAQGYAKAVAGIACPAGTGPRTIGDRRHLRGGIQFERPLPRKHAGRPGHDADGVPPARRGRAHPFRRRAMLPGCAAAVAATDKGICQIALDDDPRALVNDPQDQFAQASLEGGDEEFERWVAQVVGFVENPGGASSPLDVRGTAFQQRVWEALRGIPMGSSPPQ